MDARGPVPSIMEEFQRVDYSKWQKTEAEERKSPARRLTLPSLASDDKKGEKDKPVAFMLSKNPPSPSEPSSSPEKDRSFTQRKLALKKAELAKTLEEIRITTNLTNLKKNAIEELKQRGARLAETNRRLVKDIQHTDDSTAKRARVLLQQYEAFQRVRAMVQTFSRNRLDTARAELQEMEKTMEKNLGKLQQQLDEVTAKVQVLQDELGVLQPYIDGQYPEEAVQIVLLQRSIQNLKEQQQEEIDKAEEMGKALLEELEAKAQAEQEALLQKVVEEVLLQQDGLKQMVINNHVLRREILRQREVSELGKSQRSAAEPGTSALPLCEDLVCLSGIIKDLEEEVGELKRSIQTLRQSARDPRELIFADVLLRRPKCTPDTEVVLSIPAEGTPPVGCSARLRSQAPRPARGSAGMRC
ncbi:uncharacterized protein C20orf96 homolog [Egretta garzetta]|uniref:uncharacterized protein C20orf96 homolog n=1 Tax=Egretta garzetta TaxID=188379 RepID=UPI00163CC74B|nr:uncharacterized protein C20orf96 homolog [Egretta garzetta]